MAKSITLRDVPDEVRDELAARAALAGRSLQEHLRAELIAMASKPTAASLMAEVRRRKEAAPAELSADEILAALRAGRG